jgi:bifunctional non-homologous end joining protein LigD
MIAQSPPKGDAWVHEVKLDGYRALITKTGDRARIFTRSGAECTERLPQMVEAFANLPTISAVLDGELCFVGPDSCANFYALMREMRTSSPDESCLMFFAFDLLQENDVDLRALPLSERRRDLERLCRKARVPFLKLIEQFPDGQALFRYACEYDFEGTVSKRLVSRYASGPSRHWVKCRAPHWERDNAERYRLFEKPRKPPAPTERERALQRRKAELARLHERLTEPKLRPGVVDALRAQEKALLQEIAELES